MIPIKKILLFETDLLDPFFFGTKDGITTTLQDDDTIELLDIQLVTYSMNSLVKGAFSEAYIYGGEDGGINESTGKNEKEYELQFNMPLENRDNINRFAGSQYSLLAERIDGSKFVVFGQFEADKFNVDNRLQNRMTLKTGRTSARIYEVLSYNVDQIQYIIDNVVTPQPPAAPLTPTGLMIDSVTETSVFLSWNSQEDRFLVLE
jgi:hypothetical protein